MKIDIVIVNWNAGHQLRDCIESVWAHHSGLVGQCVAVDNGSTDGSTDFLVGAQDVDLIRASQNLGFARACNLGAARCDSELILFLNPDARLLPGALAVPLDYLQRPEHTDVAIAGVQLLDEDGLVQRSCAKFPSPAMMFAKAIGISAFVKSWDYHMSAWDHSQSRTVDHVIGAFYLIRKNVFRQLGGFDERFFVYLEDLDLSRRAASAGFKSVYLTEAQAFHKGGGVSERVKAHRLFYSLRSRIQYAFKHFGHSSALAVSFATLAIEPLSRLALLLATLRFREIVDLARGYSMLWGWVLRGGKGGA